MSFAKNSCRTLFVRIFLIIVSMVGGIINARYLGADGIGLLALFLLIPAICFRFGNLGFGSGITFFIARNEISERFLLKAMIIFSLVMSTLASLMFFLLLRIKVSPWNDISANIITCGLVLVPAIFIKNFVQRFLSGFLKIKAINISEIISSSVYVVMLIILVVFFKLNIYGSILSYMISECFVLVYFFCVIRLMKIPYNNKISYEKKYFQLTKKIFTYSKWNYLVMLINFFLEQLPIMVLKSQFAVSDVGYFAISKGLINKIKVVPESFAQVLFPYTAVSKNSGAVLRTNMLCRIFFLFTLFVSFFLFFTIKYLIIFFYGIEYIHSADIFNILLPSIVLFPYCKFMNIHISAIGKPYISFYIFFASLCVSSVSCYFLIPVYRARGAAISITITYFFMSILTILVYKIYSKSKFIDLFLVNKTDFLVYSNIVSKISLNFLKIFH